MIIRSLAGLVLLVSIAGCSREATEEVTSDTVVPVTTSAAAVGTIRATLLVTGTVTAAPGADLLVIAPEPARIAEIPHAEGDRVRRGDVLVRFEIPSYTADVATKRGEVTRAEARLQNARAAQTRAHDLFDRGIAARKEVEDADRELADAQAGVAESEATLGAAQTSAARATVRATFDGVVAKRTHNPGDSVEAAASDPVLRVVDPKRLEVTASIPVADVQRIATGAAAQLASPSGGTTATLKVVSRPAAVDANTATAPIRLAFVTPTAIPIGAPVQLTIDAEEHRDVVLVPAAAVTHEGEEAAVFVVNGEKAERRVVMLGITDDAHAEIRSGIKAGEAVIVTGQAGLPDGAAITLAKPEPAQ
jgi:cobalt-zinc-cadmium efflux system membrane fusion protein